MSGKGGVGKSTVSTILANELRQKGYKVGILDADITGPSIPRLTNTQNKKAMMSTEEMIIPIITENGIKVMSLNFLLEDENQPVIWRGPIVGSTAKKFWTDTLWEDLDYLIIDMPPGTGDVALTVMQSVPINGIVMVSIPQDLVSMIVSKGVNMARKLDIPVIGVVENMSYILCPDCDSKIRLYEGENTEQFLNDMDLKLLGEIPMCKEITDISKNGMKKITNKEIKDILENMTNNIISSL